MQRLAETRSGNPVDVEPDSNLPGTLLAADRIERAPPERDGNKGKKPVNEL
jgi:hypothetical protein